MLLVERVGPSATLQDCGRLGWLSAGIGRAGAADRASSRLANRLVGNLESAACVEVLLGGLTVRAPRGGVVAVTGAPAPIDVDGVPMGHASVIRLRSGSVLRLGMARHGMRCYLAVRGGVEVPAVLGSRSRDTLAGIGPRPLSPGDVLPVGVATQRWPAVDVAPLPAPRDGVTTAEVILGPRDDWFARPRTLFDGVWRCGAEADRVGIRLDRVEGPALERTVHRELPPEGTPLGAIQVPPDGRPVVFLADHPVTGGYPVVGVVVDAHIDRLAQVRPGGRIVFRAGHPRAALSTLDR